MKTNGGFLVTKIKQLGDRIFEKILSEKNIDAFNGAQGRILYVLWQEDGISIRSLSVKCGLAITSLTTMLERMEHQGLIRRIQSETDKRKTLLFLTEKAHAGKKKVLRTFLFHHLELTRKEFRVSEVINHMPAFHVVAGIAICTPHCAANDDIHVLNLIFDTNTHDFCHSSRFFLMRSRHSSNRVISSFEKPL